MFVSMLLNLPQIQEKDTPIKTAPKGAAKLTHFDADAWKRLAREVGFLSFDKSDDSVLSCMNRKVARHVSSRAGDFSAAGLADEDLTVADFLSTETLNAKALTSIIVDVFGGTASFNV